MRRLIPLAAALLASACAVPGSPPVTVAKTAPELALAGPSVTLAPDWWSAIGDPQLDRLVTDALAGNPSLDVAAARVRQAEATLARQDAELRPDAALDVNVQGQRLSSNYIIPPPFAGTVRALGTGQAGLNWNLDLFGRQKAAIAGAAAQLQAAEYDRAAARLMLAGAVVQSYVELARAERQATIAERTIATRQQSLGLVQVREQNRLASRIDITAAQTLVSQAQLALVQAQGARALAADALAALAGRGGDYARALQPTRLAADTALPVPATLPADLLARRPDVAAAQARIAAAAAQRQVARRAFYPNINLSALVGLQAIGFGNFVALSSGIAGGGAAIHLPLFDSGRRTAELRGATAAVDVATAQYNESVVAAARDAADAIARVQAADAARVRQREVVTGLAETNRLNGVRVQSGLSSRLDLVNTDIRLLDAELADANLAIDSLAARAQLATALGGGFALPTPTPTGKPKARRRAFLILGAVLLVVLIIWAIMHFFFAPPEEETDDAYVAGDVVAITARDPGTVTQLHADNTQSVTAGQPLIDLDPTTADVNVAAAAAELARAVRSTRADFTRVGQSDAGIVQAEAELNRARDDYARRRGAAQQGAISGEELSHAADAVKVATANLRLAREQRRQAQSTVQGTDVNTSPAVLAAVANYRHAAVARGHMHVIAPIAGVVAQRTVQVGQQVNAGTPLMAIVPLDRLWVDANFRETQLKDLRIGQPVKLTADMYGGDIVYHGRVIGLAAGSGNAFALLPPQNASGNWIKIVQRVPVRVALDPRELRANPLRVGLSVDVTVDTADQRGARLARTAASPYRGDTNVGTDPKVEAEIRRIVAANR